VYYDICIAMLVLVLGCISDIENRRKGVNVYTAKVGYSNWWDLALLVF
jgi:hypothetical protein